MASSMRSTWKGHIQFSLVTVPVKVYSAISTSEAVKLNQLHKGCKSGVSQIGLSKYCKVCNQSNLTGEMIEKGYQFETNKFVLVTDEDLKRVKVATDKTVQILGFVDPSEVPTAFLDESYFIAPDGQVATKPYALLRDSMKSTGKVALGKVCLRDREEQVVIAPHENGLMLQKLHPQHEVRLLADVPGIELANAKLAAGEMDLGTKLVTQMSTTFAELDQTDHYHEALKAMLFAKQTGGTYTASETATTAPALDIMAALQASLDAATAQRKPNAKAKAADAPPLTLVKEKAAKKKKVA